MYRLKYIFLSLAVFGMFIGTAKAVGTCDYTQRATLNNEASEIRANYEIKEKELDPNLYGPPDSILGTEEEETWVPKTDYLQINILNLTENLYIEVSSDKSSDVTRYNFSDTNNGTLAIEWNDVSEVARLTITVKSTGNNGCQDDTIRTMTLTLPRYNSYSTYGMCEVASDYYLCQEYVTFGDIDFADFIDNVTAEVDRIQNGDANDEEDLSWLESIGKFISEHKVPFIVGGISLVVIVGIVVVVIIKRRRSSEI